MKKPAVVILATTLLAATAPLTAFTLVEANKVPVARGATFSVQVTLREAAAIDRSHQLSANAPYRVDVFSMGDGSVRASFFDATGRKAGEANGIIAVLRRGGASATGAPAPGENVSVQKVQPAGSGEAANFAKLGFGPNSPSKLVSEGQRRNLEISSNDGSHGILIGLNLPAVQKGNVQLPAVQKVREAASQPNK
ncbi:MAG: hypothetical protein WCC53_05620 [Thermoanaerobaculia bacterium]|jgi:hypothetical protein